ncbi:XRE family transcriptional regulator [Agrobacterium rhizogenes]|uniref:Helix-turn-helix domain protein n=1 Tax=Rhizobium rhizogenes TaxID=359 RepID=A0A7S4ZT36_RHIRH|nr:helix-turn-helix transcriptional regulator [Rhizobium rhizogenes]NTG30117.1 XRE family transcriptional regulator [Rhizobium rhizogenes]NTI06524.1 XRE family transcriptional regulator [Rhizobium rhizogenes]NTI13329.1 XRE family transcriptional regulator [Rhizobium rhizogenes]QCL09345.1 helix-turn-helix domain protein [Rhizobium rhizogenes]QCL09767.1 helix-turn-helix domain protein [Rhizobium rhizogenes]
MKTEHVEVHASNPNIFAELGLPDAENHFLKAQIVAALYRLVTEQKLNQAKAGALMGITQPEVSRLFRGHFREYSVERLMGFLTSFNQDVEITVRPHAKAGEAGSITFNAAFV